MWLYFDVVPGGGVKMARCKDDKCKNYPIELPDNSTIKLWRHLNSHHPEAAALEEDIKKKKAKKLELLKIKNKENMSKFVFKPNPQLLLPELFSNNLPSYQKSHPIQKRFHRNLKNLMVHDAQPFTMASSSWFKRLVKDLDARVQVKSRHSYSKEVKKEGKVVKKRSREHVRRNVTVGYAATTDMWTSKGQQDYLGINAQFIDSSWRWQKIVVACRPFDDRHSGENIKNVLSEESNALDLDDSIIKVFVSDTASDMVAGGRVDGYSSFSCCVHRLMLVGQDAEKAEGTEEIAAALLAARSVVTHSNHCSPFHRTMKKYCKANHHNCTKLVGSVKTRWNSNKMMVTRLLEHRVCIQDMESDSAVPNMPIIEVSQWRILRQLRDILAPMETVTKIWESETEPSMNRVGVEVFNLKTVWGDMLQKEVDAYYDSLLLEEPAIICFFRSLLLNLDRRFPQLGMDTDLAAWGNIFDPRFKVNLS